MEALHVQIEAFTASYSYPFLKSGTQLTLPVPPFSGILGNLSACAGRQIAPDETLIGFEFESNGRSIDLERTRRLQTDSKHGRLSENPERGIAKREFHVGPKLDLYLTCLALEADLYAPAAAPCLGDPRTWDGSTSSGASNSYPLSPENVGRQLSRFRTRKSAV